MANGAQQNAWSQQWDTWLSARTDALLSLEDRVRASGTGSDEADVAAAFVARKAITDRLVAMAAAGGRNGEAAALAAQPVHDDMGGVVGTDLDDAARLLDSVLAKVEQHVQANERVGADLVVADGLAQQLGMQINHVAELREQMQRGGDMSTLLRDAAEVRASLEAADADRQAMLARWSTVAGRLDDLVAVETRAREAEALCRSKIVQTPPLAVPSVTAFRDEVELDVDLTGMPWAAARGRIGPVLAKLDRLTAALAEAERRFREPLTQRDDLRGLLQSFADKASVRGVLELADLDSLFREAKDALWTAPCDLVRAKALVDRYVTAVNERVERTPR